MPAAASRRVAARAWLLRVLLLALVAVPAYDQASTRPTQAHQPTALVTAVEAVAPDASVTVTAIDIVAWGETATGSAALRACDTAECDATPDVAVITDGPHWLRTSWIGAPLASPARHRWRAMPVLHAPPRITAS
jgi:hypothetical protein